MTHGAGSNRRDLDNENEIFFQIFLDQKPTELNALRMTFGFKITKIGTYITVVDSWETCVFVKLINLGVFIKIKTILSYVRGTHNQSLSMHVDIYAFMARPRRCLPFVSSLQTYAT